MSLLQTVEAMPLYDESGRLIARWREAGSEEQVRGGCAERATTRWCGAAGSTGRRASGGTDAVTASFEAAYVWVRWGKGLKAEMERGEGASVQEGGEEAA